MAIFIVLWPYLLPTKLSSFQENNFGHTNSSLLMQLECGIQGPSCLVLLMRKIVHYTNISSDLIQEKWEKSTYYEKSEDINSVITYHLIFNMAQSRRIFRDYIWLLKSLVQKCWIVHYNLNQRQCQIKVLHFNQICMWYALIYILFSFVPFLQYFMQFSDYIFNFWQAFQNKNIHADCRSF